MVDHIYWKLDLLGNIKRPHILIKELNLYIDYLQADMQKHLKELNDKKRKHLNQFKTQLQDGIAYYKGLFAQWPDQTSDLLRVCYEELVNSEIKLRALVIQ